MDARQVLADARDALTVRRVFGDPIQVNGTTVLPVAYLRGGGGGGGRAEDSGAGFGVMAKPAGVFAVRDGHVTWRPAVDVNRVILGGQMVAAAAILTLGPSLARWIASLATSRGEPSRLLAERSGYTQPVSD